MTAIEMLKRHRYRLLRLSSLRARLDVLRGAPKAPALTGMPQGKGLSGDPTAGAAERILALEAELAAEIAAAEEEARMAEALLTMLPEQQAAVLRARYIDGMSWKRVARTLHYTQSHCYAIHSAAFRRLEKDNSFS